MPKLSDANVWGRCSGSIKMREGLKYPQTDDQRLGDAVHEANCLALRDNLKIAVGDTMSNGVVLDEDAVECAKGFVVFVKSRSGSCELYIEHDVELDGIGSGRIDAGWFNSKESELVICDYKHGFRRRRPDKDLTLCSYGAGLAKKLNVQPKKYTFIVYQPRCYQIETPEQIWETGQETVDRVLNMLKISNALSKHDPKLDTGDQCRDCSGAYRCSANAEMTAALFEHNNQPFEVSELTGKRLGREYEMLQRAVKLCEGRLKSIEDQIDHAVRSGDKTTGYTLEAKITGSAWTLPIEQLKTVFETFGVSPVKEVLKTPKQIISADGKGSAAIHGLVNSFSKKTTSIKLVPLSESKTAQAFQPKKEA